MKKLGVIIGRFQPLHAGHISIIRQSLEHCDELLILVGSSNQVPSIKNPFSYEQRNTHIIRTLWSELKGGDLHKFSTEPLKDYRYNDPAWIAQVRKLVKDKCARSGANSVTLFGHFKDGNDYLKWFPQWEYCELQSDIVTNATQIREQLFIERNPLVAHVQGDWDFYEAEKQRFKDYPYPETLNFNCADAIVTCLGKVLLIKRKFAPGKDCWALPGGFKNRTETFFECAVRELFEETNLRVPDKVVIGSFKQQRLFDSPFRSFGIPRNTMAVHFDIAPDADGTIPRANGADDAAECKWVDIFEAVGEMPLYDDHRDILEVMLGIVS